MSAESTAAIHRGLDLADWSITDLWIASVGTGGAFTRDRIVQICDGGASTAQEHDILAAALNDHFTDGGEDHAVPYWRQLLHPGGG
jgi:hypothetical protein